MPFWLANNADGSLFSSLLKVFTRCTGYLKSNVRNRVFFHLDLSHCMKSKSFPVLEIIKTLGGSASPSTECPAQIPTQTKLRIRAPVTVTIISTRTIRSKKETPGVPTRNIRGKIPSNTICHLSRRRTLYNWVRISLYSTTKFVIL
jgi:hypothetical protein